MHGRIACARRVGGERRVGAGVEGDAVLRGVADGRRACGVGVGAVDRVLRVDCRRSAELLCCRQRDRIGGVLEGALIVGVVANVDGHARHRQ